ncbi:MAG: hypothetical protein P4L87_17480 [Formivibrio sp.]|nr:hypothetical protein [Formivibrio sp.]
MDAATQAFDIDPRVIAEMRVHRDDIRPDFVEHRLPIDVAARMQIQRLQTHIQLAEVFPSGTGRHRTQIDRYPLRQTAQHIIEMPGPADDAKLHDLPFIFPPRRPPVCHQQGQEEQSAVPGKSR